MKEILPTFSTWEILIPTIKARKSQLDELVAELDHQIEKNNLLQYMAVRSLPDCGELTVGKKRSLLLNYSSSDYISFFDDDDKPSSNYIETIYESICESPDAVSFNFQDHIDGKPNKVFAIGPKNIWAHSHLCAVKRELAIQCNYPDQNVGEDIEWADQLRMLIKSEIHIDQVLYNRYWSPK